MDARELEHRIESLYGDVDWRNADGLLHVAAIDAATGAVLAIGPASPASATDRFILGLARARADFILTSGSVLRAEPDLVHAFSEDAKLDQALRTWRRRVLECDGEPSLVIVSYSGDIPLKHPSLGASRAGIVWTAKHGRNRLGSSVSHFKVEEGIVESSQGEQREGPEIGQSLGRLIEFLRTRHSAKTILIEAGPTLSQAFYVRPAADSLCLNELLLSRFEGDVPPEALGPSFVSEETIGEVFPNPCTRTTIREPSGRWHFERYRTPMPA
jgi:riboflavin biosynthesis pyrimidine reductase